MNIYDISKEAGVSIATVSRVMNGSTKVSEKNRQKILSIIEKHGYTPNPFARGLGLNTMKTVGLLCANSSDHFFSRAIYHLEVALRDNNYDAILSCTGKDLISRQNYLKLLLSKKVDAVILIGSSFIEETKQKNQYIIDAAKEVPVIIMNGYLDAENVYCVHCDDMAIMEHATLVFLEHGFEKPLFLCRTNSYSGRQKISGFLKAFEHLGKETDGRRVIFFDGTIPEMALKLRELELEGLEFDGILASDDELAIGALKYAKAWGRKVPEEFPILGYNNSQLGICCEPELSTIDGQLAFCCNHAVSSLMNVLNGKNPPNRTQLSARIIQKGTTDFF